MRLLSLLLIHPTTLQRHFFNEDALNCDGMVQVAAQLQALLEEKARLASENARLAHENSSLQV